MVAAKRRGMHVSRFQAVYLLDLIKDDVQNTELTNDEMHAAEALVGRLEDVITYFDTPRPEREASVPPSRPEWVDEVIARQRHFESRQLG